jgi:hypothetical protein
LPESEHVFLCESELEASQERYGKPFVVRRTWPMNLCKGIGVKTFGPHAIGHLSASFLDDKRYPIAVIQTLLRHKSASTTARYLHKLRGMRVALDDAFVRKERPEAEAQNEIRPTTCKPAEGRPLLQLIRFLRGFYTR